MKQAPKRRRPVVAIDGPAGVGKSTTARTVARTLDYILVDTGALYRGVALACQEQGTDWGDEPSVAIVADNVALSFASAEDGAARLQLDGMDRDDDIRTPQIASGASQVSAYPAVREALLGLQRKLGEQGGVVLEGRDIGTVVFPDAEVKVFLTASAAERAKRRVGDLHARGLDADFDELLRQITERDEADSSRAVAPLKPADDAVLLDSTDLDAEAVVSAILKLVADASARLV